MAEVKARSNQTIFRNCSKALGRELDTTKDQQAYINSLVDKIEYRQQRK